MNKNLHNKSERKFRTGLVIGKFYPPHRGHKYLIDTALSQCDQVTVIVCWKPTEIIPGSLRGEWIQKIHPNANVKVLEDYDLDDDDSAGWAKFTVEYLGFVPDAVFTSEDYGDPYAKFMGSTHVQVDKARQTFPISGTLVRSDPHKYFEFLEPCVRAHFVKRVAIIGAESTGKTTLSKDLSEHYKTVWAPEYVRIYLEGIQNYGKNKIWKSSDLQNVAEGQNLVEEHMAQLANKVLICDTTALSTSVWHERYMNHKSKVIDQISKDRKYDLHILTSDEIPWVDDGTRESEAFRHWMHQRFIERLEEDHKKYVVVSGSKEARTKAAIAAIDLL